MSSTDTLYSELLRLLRDAALLSSCGSVLGWDRETYMPHGGVELRSEQLSLLAGLAHEASTRPRIGELLNALEEVVETGSTEDELSVTVRETRRRYDRATKLPRRLVEELSRVTALAQQAWADARRASDFAGFQPWLEQIVLLKREEARIVVTAGQTDYDGLLDEFEPGASSEDVAAIFSGLRDELVPLLRAIQDCGREPNREILKRTYDVATQSEICRLAATAIGFDFDRGRLDITTHPFCSGFGPGDCRLTTRYDAKFFNSGFFGTLHEAGHGLYEQGLRREAWGTPLGESVSLGIHESQSRLWENMVGRSRSFWDHFFPQVREAWPESLRDVDVEEFHFAVNDVRPSFIRVEADEVTYNLHIMMRFELEKELISGNLKPSDLPQAWNDHFENDFGIRPETDADGCLQDVHWSAGLIGYFPTYALGNLYAAQLFDAAQEEIGSLEDQFRSGEFTPLLNWLRRQIHHRGQTYPAPELIRKISGQTLSHAPLMKHLWNRFGTLYAL